MRKVIDYRQKLVCSVGGKKLPWVLDHELPEIEGVPAEDQYRFLIIGKNGTTTRQANIYGDVKQGSVLIKDYFKNAEPPAPKPVEPVAAKAEPAPVVREVIKTEIPEDLAQAYSSLEKTFLVVNADNHEQLDTVIKDLAEFKGYIKQVCRAQERHIQTVPKQLLDAQNLILEGFLKKQAEVTDRHQQMLVDSLRNFLGSVQQQLIDPLKEQAEYAKQNAENTAAILRALSGDKPVVVSKELQLVGDVKKNSRY